MTRIYLLIFLYLLFAICPVKAQETLTVFAAASLTDAFEEIAVQFEDKNPGVDVVFNFGSSATLATQIIEGAPADVFASANAAQMNIVRDADLLDGRPRTFVKNRLVLIVPADNPAGIESLRDLSNDGVQLVVAAPGVPVRDYTDTMLERLAGVYGEEYRQSVTANIVSEEDNVRQVAAKIALGEADAGIVYRSDVTPDLSESVLALPIPDALNTIATYPIATLQTRPELAQLFIDTVLSDEGQAVMVKWGFIPVKIPALPPTISLPESGVLTIDGQVLNPLTLTIDDLRKNFGENGILLWDVLNTAQPNLNADTPDDQLSMYLVVTGFDGRQVVISWAEIAPEYGNQPVMLIYDDVIRLDAAGRSIENVANISLRDAPAVGTDQ